jgi:hypothetical protein
MNEFAKRQGGPRNVGFGIGSLILLPFQRANLQRAWQWPSEEPNRRRELPFGAWGYCDMCMTTADVHPKLSVQRREKRKSRFESKL